MELQGQLEAGLSKKLKLWLSNRDWTTDELLSWLQGLELPAIGYEEEPYVWIIRSLPLADERPQAERELARRLSSLLALEPDVKHSSNYSPEILYNLLMLCAEIQCPDELTESLYQVYERKSLSGEWRAIDLRQALVSALIYNQLDNRLAPVWDRMFEERDEFLPGDHYTAFAGILYKPESSATRGEPHLDAIGKALARLADHVESQKNGQVEFLRLLDWVKEAYPRTPDYWAKHLIEQAHKHDWTPWAIVRLDLVCELKRTIVHGFDGYYYYIWDAYYPFLNQVSMNARDEWKHLVIKIDSLCGGKILKVFVSSDTNQLLIALTVTSELERRKACAEFSSYDTLYKIACATFSDTAKTYLENSRAHGEETDAIVKACQKAGIYSLAQFYPVAGPRLTAMAARRGGRL